MMDTTFLALQIAKENSRNIDPRIAMVFASQFILTEPVNQVIEHLPSVVNEGRCLILSGEPGNGKTVAMHFAYALQAAYQLSQQINYRRQQHEEYINTTRPSILAEGEPLPPNPDQVESVSLPKTLHEIALRRYRRALEEPKPFNEEQVAKELVVNARYTVNVYRAKSIIDLAFDDKNWLDKLKRQGYLLGIDDLGVEHMTDSGWQLSLWDDFFDHRYRKRLPLIVTTNLKVGEFKTRYGTRIVDRLREWGTFIDMKSRSLRKQT